MSPESPKGAFPFGKENRKKELETKEKRTRRERLLGNVFGIKPRGYTLTDSGLEGHVSTFDGTFGLILPPGEESLRDYIERELAPRKGKAIGVEFGGPARKLFAGFSEGFFKKTAGVNLVDPRRTLFSDEKTIDIERHHNVIPGDVLSERTYERLNDWLDGDKIDLIFERMMAAWENMPNDPFTIGKIFQRWYGLLAEGGLMFLEVPHKWAPLVVQWAKQIDVECKEVVEIQLSRADSAFPYGIRLKKMIGAPETLPMLNPRAVRRISKVIRPR